jgi:formyltetrahydrofolate synthetase
MSIFKNSIQSKHYIEPLGTVTLSAGPDTLKTINLQTFGQIKKAAIVIAGATITGAAVVTWYGSDATSGGNLTAIAACTMAISSDTCVLQIDGEDISEAAERAGLLPEGFLSLQCKIDGTNTDEIDAVIFVDPLHQRLGLTPSDVTALT